MRVSLLILATLLCMGFEWEGRLNRLQRELETGDARQRREVVRLMASYSADEVRAPLLQALQDRDPAVRREAAETAGRVRLADAVPFLLEWLEDEDADVRAGAAGALGNIGDTRSIPSLVRALGDASSSVRRQAIAALGRMSDPAVVVPLLGRLDDDDPEVRIEAAQILSRLGDERAVVPLVGRARDESPDVRQAVYQALGALADLRASAALIQSLRDDSEPARLAAVGALGRLAAPRAVQPLAELVRTGDARSAQAALSALGNIGNAPALRAITGALTKRELRDTAMQVLSGHRAPELTALLGEALAQSRDDGQATAIARVLSRRLSRQPAVDVAPALTSALEAGRGAPEVLLRALARSGDPSVLVVLLEALQSDRDGGNRNTQRGAALVALGDYFSIHPPDGRAADPLLAILGDVEPTHRAQVVRLLGQVGASRALPAIRPLLEHRDPALRLAAVEAIGAIGDPQGADALLALLDAREPSVRFRAAQSLGNTASEDVVVALLTRLNDPEPTDRHAALLALGGTLEQTELTEDGAEQTARTLRAMMQSPDRPLAARAIETTGRWNHPRGRALLQQAASRGRLRADAVRASRDPAIVREAIASPARSVRWAALARMGDVGAAEDLPVLLQTIAEDRWPGPSIAAFSVARLARRGVHAEPAQLCEALSHRDAYLRANLLVALTAAAAQCPGRTPTDYLDGTHAPVVRVAAARWLRAVDRSPAAIDAFARCVNEDLAPEVARACSLAELPAMDQDADVYAYAADGTTLLRSRLIAIRFEDGSALLVETDPNAHVRWERAPEGRILLDDPLRTPLQP
ncbi:MAG: HEAT repeat domain-containing protein [Myxococcota bacterium]